jgi:hypothetical protein
MRRFIGSLCSQLTPALYFISMATGLAGTVYAQVSVTKSEFHGRESYSLQNSSVRVSVLTGGSYIAELTLISSSGREMVNPMFIPHYSTIDPHNYNLESHQDLYGIGRNAKLMAGYMGHYLCFPYFGGSVTSAEEELGYSTHGEAYTVKYEVEERMEEDAAVISATAELPLTKYAVSRSFTLLPEQSVVLVEEEIQNLENFDRPYHWVQHVTFGKPFIEYGKTKVDAPVTKIAFSANKDDPSNRNSVQWPNVSTESGETINSGIFSSDKGEGGYRAWLMDSEREYTWFTMYHTELDLLVGYIFSKDENPWIGDWQENQRSQVMPRSGKTVAWGLEVGTTPFGGGVSSIEREPVFGTKTFRLIGAKEKKKQSYLIFLMEIEDGFKGVKHLKLEKGAIRLEEKHSGRQMVVTHGFGSSPLSK